MSYRDFEFKTAYDTGMDDVVTEFYIPALMEAKRYDRITGFFSSSSLALAARGIICLIKNKGTMRLVCCPVLQKDDLQIIKESASKKENVISKRLISDIKDVEDEFEENHVKALGWMLDNGLLEIKIALLKSFEGIAADNPIMHQKVGILYDTDFDSISFSGSNNETASGWLYNVEEFKVFKAWVPGQKDYYDADKRKFDLLWNNNHPAVDVKPLPEAVKKHLIKEGKDFDFDSISLKKYKKIHGENSYSNTRVPIKIEKKTLHPFSYQQEAIDQWKKSGVIILEMATGTGKTKTSIGCMAELLKTSKRPVLVVISCPQNTLTYQWKDDIEEHDIMIDESVICDGTKPKWRSTLKESLSQLSIGLLHSVVVYTTHDTCHTKDFVDIISEYAPNTDSLFIADEVHGLGASQTKNGLLDVYKYRIGCSATPNRWYDEYGSKVIQDYFNHESFVFDIKDALATINPATSKPFLVNYYYHPCFVSLTDDELEEYHSLTKKIVRLKKGDDFEEIRERLLFKRADIEKNAENKYDVLAKILGEIKNEINDTIIFVSSEQMRKVMKMLGNLGIRAHEFTQEQSATPSAKYGGLSERQFIINKFKEGDYQVLVAIKCLDEGIDIPSAKRGIIMASSTNPREYVQRTGRIIRQDKGKESADLYDLIIEPDMSSCRDEVLCNFERQIFSAELRRVKDLSENAINSIDIVKEIYRKLGDC